MPPSNRVRTSPVCRSRSSGFECHRDIARVTAIELSRSARLIAPHSPRRCSSRSRNSACSLSVSRSASGRFDEAGSSSAEADRRASLSRSWQFVHRDAHLPDQLPEPAPLGLRLQAVETMFPIAVACASRTARGATAMQMASTVPGIADTAAWLSAPVLRSASRKMGEGVDATRFTGLLAGIIDHPPPPLPVTAPTTACAPGATRTRSMTIFCVVPCRGACSKCQPEPRTTSLAGG